MAGGGFSKLPNGSVVVAITLTGPPDGAGPGAPIRVLVHAVNRARALTRLRNLGLRAVYLRGNAEPPTPDEITAVLHHPDGVLWRARPERAQELWHPIRALLRPAVTAVTAVTAASPGPAGASVPGMRALPARRPA
ncbi:hypothetical protein OG772_22645 [Streptomyces sp. NBC_01321]|uniref:hypothetical protein n=1 Tax=Streptomyces sp. NBC_01321 TaxID=2903825 RepID=UPI002E0E9FB9|nr:hypothetical protein OG772_22645 [Streptomyces sp. NBC_01321]